MGICGTGMASGLGMTTLGGDARGRYSLGRRIGRRIERGRVQVFESVALCGFVCGGIVVVVRYWINLWSASIANS